MIHNKLTYICIFLLALFLWCNNRHKIVLHIPTTIQVVSGEVSNIVFTPNPSDAHGQLNVLSDNATINLPIIYVPKMMLRLDTQRTPYRVEPISGLIQFDLPSGNHHFNLQLQNTSIRTISNYISLLFLFAFIIKAIRVKK